MSTAKPNLRILNASSSVVDTPRRSVGPDLAGDGRDQGESVILVRDLHMFYGDFEAVRGIDLEVEHGEIFAFVGPNGAGKTTTVEMLEGYRPRRAGEVEVLGVDPATPTRSGVRASALSCRPASCRS